MAIISETNPVWQIFARIVNWVADRFADAEQDMWDIPARQVGFVALSYLAFAFLSALLALMLPFIAFTELLRLFKRQRHV